MEQPDNQEANNALNDGVNEPPQPREKDGSPFFFKIIVTVIVGLGMLSIIHPSTRSALANLPLDVFLKGQVWRLFTAELVTHNAIDCIFSLFFAYTSIGIFEKRVGSAVFIVDFIIIGLLLSLILGLLGLLQSLFISVPEEIQMRQLTGFLGVYFFYMSRCYLLDPDKEMPILCFVIKQRQFPSLFYMILISVTTFRVPPLVTIAYLLVTLEEACFRGRFFRFNFYFYLRLQRTLNCVAKRDDFYKIQDCRDSYTFFNNGDELHRLYIEAEILFRNLQQIQVLQRQNPPLQPEGDIEAPAQPAREEQNPQPTDQFHMTGSSQHIKTQARDEDFQV